MKIGQLGLPLPSGQKIVADAYKNGGARIISHDIDITELVENALDDGLLKCMSSEFYSKFHQDQLSYFCNKYGFYGLPTDELVITIKEIIGDRTAIEIGSGNGCLGRSLNIHRTDNKMQQWPDIKQKYKEGNCPTIYYPNDVKKIDYKKAILKYKPQVVVASWVTHNDLNIYGMDEQWILDNCETYIHFGHTEVHNRKRINDIEHVSLKLEPLNWMFSRSFRKSPILQIWGNNK